MEFTPITTEEGFLAAVREKYGDVEDLQGKLSAHEKTIGERDATIAQLQGQVNGYKVVELKQKIAKEKGIPMEMASRLAGDDEKALRADADALSAGLKAIKGAAPLANPNAADKEESATRAGLRNILRNLKGE